MRLLNRLLERTQLVKGLRVDLEHTREQRNNMHRMFDELHAEYVEYLKYPQGLGRYFQVGMEIINDPVRRVLVSVTPRHHYVEWAMMDTKYGNHAMRYVSEMISKDIAKHIQPQIEEQLCRLTRTSP